MDLAVYIPTRGYVYCEVIQALNDLGISPFFMRGTVSWSMVMNRIVEDFLVNKRGDILLTIDDDTIPPENLLDVVKPIVDGQFSVVGGIVPITKPGFPAFPNVYQYDGENWKPDVTARKGVAEVEVIGSACLAVSKDLLIDDGMQAPFLEEFHPNGVIKLGGDIRFCQRARENMFDVAAHYDVSCEHYTPVHVNERTMVYNAMISSALDQGYNEGFRDATD